MVSVEYELLTYAYPEQYSCWLHSAAQYASDVSVITRPFTITLEFSPRQYPEPTSVYDVSTRGGEPHSGAACWLGRPSGCGFRYTVVVFPLYSK
jgi:hypothetical protein